MEVNARLQVEHPVTEVTTGLDLVKLQLRLAAGERLEGDPPPVVGHAIEARLNAEDSDRDFAPAPGEIELLRVPAGPGMRIDTGFEEGDVIPAEFDSMIAKVIAHGRTRDEALARLGRALSHASVLVRGERATAPSSSRSSSHPDFQAGRVDVGWIDRLVESREHRPGSNAEVALCEAAILAYEVDEAYERTQFLATAARGRPDVGPAVGHDVVLRHLGASYQLHVLRLGPHTYRVDVDGCSLDVEVAQATRHRRRLTIAGRAYGVLSAEQSGASLVEVDGIPHRIARDDGGTVRAPAPCVVVAVPVQAGDIVAAGDALIVLEAMKMETVVRAEVDGRVREVVTRANEQVSAGRPLLVLEPVELADAAAPASRADFAKLVAAQGSANLDHDACRAASRRASRHVPRLRRPAAAADRVGHPCGEPSVSPEERRRREDEILSAFVDVAALFRRAPADDDDADFGRSSTSEYLFTYLRDLRSVGRGLPEPFVDQLRRTLRHYGVESLEPSLELEQALYRIARSHRGMDQQVGSVLALLERRLDHASRVPRRRVLAIPPRPDHCRDKTTMARRLRPGPGAALSDLRPVLPGGDPGGGLPPGHRAHQGTRRRAGWFRTRSPHPGARRLLTAPQDRALSVVRPTLLPRCDGTCSR